MTSQTWQHRILVKSPLVYLVLAYAMSVLCPADAYSTYSYSHNTPLPFPVENDAISGPADDLGVETLIISLDNPSGAISDLVQSLSQMPRGTVASEEPQGGQSSSYGQEGLSWLPSDLTDQATPTRSVSSWQAIWQGIPIQAGIVKLHRNLENRATRLIIPAPVYQLVRCLDRGDSELTSGAWLHNEQDIRAHWQAIALDEENDLRLFRNSTSQHEIDKVWLMIGRSLQPGYRLTAFTPRTPDDLLLLMDAETGKVVYSSQISRHLSSTGSGLVFNPNPVVSSGDRTLSDGDDVDPWRVEAQLHDLNGTGFLRGKWAHIQSTAPLAYNTDLSFSFSSRNMHFEEVMAYYHLTEAQRYIQSIGFTGLNARPQIVMVHATGFDESWFSPIDQTIYLGDGGVDDGEDADIILHEYGHTLFQAAVGGTGNGEMAAVNEGFADFFSASRTGDSRIGDWNASHRLGGCHRNLAEIRQYPADLSGESHHDGVIWGGVLWRVREDLGPLLGDCLAIESLYFITPQSRMVDAARGLLAAGIELSETNGNPGILAAVREALSEGGFLPQTGQVTLDAGLSALYLPIPLRFPFMGPGAESTGLCDSLFVGPNGLLLLKPVVAIDPTIPPEQYQTHLPALAPLMTKGDSWLHDSLAVSWTGSPSEIRLKLRFLDGDQVLRLVEVMLSADGSIELNWSGIGGHYSFPAITGWFPNGLNSSTEWIDLPTSPHIEIDNSEGIAVSLPTGPFGLQGALWRLSTNDRGYVAALIHSPLPLEPELSRRLIPFPSPARLSDRIAFRISVAGSYDFRVLDLSGRVIVSEQMTFMDNGIHEIQLNQLSRGNSVLSTGVYYLQLTGRDDNSHRESLEGKLLLIR